MKRLAWALIGFGTFLTATTSLYAEIDTRRISLSSEFADPVVWQNVEGAPFWVAGRRPRYDFEDRSHHVELLPGEEVQLIVPTGEGVLVQGAAEEIATLEWSTSNGSGLWARAVAIETEETDQLLLPFSVRSTRLISIRHTRDATRPIDIKLFVSRRDRGTTLRFERTSIPLRANRRTLFLGLQHQPGPLYELSPGNELTVEVDGPHRYLLEHRVFYPRDASDRRFNYRVELRAGDRSSESEFVASPEVRDWATVGGRTRVVGRLMRSYINVPAGHRVLAIRTDAPLLARLLGPFDEHRAKWARHTGSAVEGSAWLADWSTIEADAVSAPRSNAHQRALLRIARDNRRGDAGLLAAERAIAEARAMPNIPSLRRFAQTLSIAQIGYRGLLPHRNHEASDLESRSYIYVTAAIRSPVDDRDRYVLGDQHATSLRRQTLSGRFAPLPEDGEELVYTLPERSASSRLRLALQPRGPAGDTCRLSIDLDEDHRVELRVGSTPDPNLLDVGAAAVATSLQSARGDIPGDVAGLGWSSETSTTEFDLPRSSHLVRVRATDCEGRRIALAYGIGRTDSMNEVEYRATVSAIGGPEAATRLFFAALDNLDEVLDGETTLASAVGEVAGDQAWQRAASARLLNHWIPSFERLRAWSIAHRHQSEPIESIEPRTVEASATSESRSGGDLRALAIELEADKNWLAAYEAWMEIARAGTLEAASRGRLRAAQALLESGEAGLAATILKSETNHAPDQTLRAQAFEQLAAIYQRQGNDVGLEGLLASRVMSTVGHARGDALARLSHLALKQGRRTLALRLDLILPEASVDRERRIEAAYLNGWWATFEEALSASEEAMANRWRGHRAQQAGDFSGARRHWRDADSLGRSALEALERAFEIREELVDGDASERHHALQRWADWRSRLPGRRIWKPAEELVVREDGGERLRSRSIGAYSRWARSTPDRPVRIRVVGPTKLRIDTRPLLSEADPRSEPGWLTYRTRRRHWRSPLGRASISTGLERLQDGRERVGTRSRSQLVIEPGIHEIEIFDPRGPTLVRLFEERAQFDFAILPELGPGALDWLSGNSPPAATSAVDCSSFAGHNICSRPLLVLPKAADESDAFVDLTKRFDAALFEEATGEGSDPAWPPLIPAAELPPADATVSKAFRPATGPEEIVRDTWLIEERNRQSEGRMTRVGALADLSLDDSMIQRLSKRTMSNFRWKRIKKVVESAGVRLVPQALGAPRSPASRRARPLLGAFCRESDRLREAGELVLDVEVGGRRPLTIELELCHATTRTPRPASALIEVDGEVHDEFQLDATTQIAKRDLTLEPGEHSIRVLAPIVPRGQTIGVRVVQNGRPINPNRKRAYHLARPGSPVVMEIEGPTRLRIDRLHAGVTRTTYRSIPAEGLRLELTAEDRSEMLYRVTRAVRNNAARKPRKATRPRPGPEFPRRLIASLDEPPPPPERLAAQRVGAGPEDGTWTATARYISRSTDDDDPRSRGSEAMGELRGTHRFRNRSWGFYSRTDLLARPRKDGGPTFGGRTRWVWPSFGVWRGLERRASLTTFLQPPTDGPNQLEGMLGGQVEAALPHSITARLRHRPSVAVFARWLSLGDRNGYPRENLDRDVFTPYKADHLYGLRMKDSLSFRPIRDVLTKFDIGIQSNEDFNVFSPDRLSLGLSGAGLYEGLEISAGYAWRHYFEDGDRNEDIDRHDLFLNLQLERWMPLARRWQFGVRTRYEITRGTTDLMLTLSFHLGRDRGFRDFAPNSIRFRSERDLSRRRQTNSSRRDTH